MKTKNSYGDIREWIFDKDAANNDINTLKKWEAGLITSAAGAARFARDNGWAVRPTAQEFRQLASQFGYIRSNIGEEK